MPTLLTLMKALLICHRRRRNGGIRYLLDAEGRHRRDHRVPRVALQSPTMSALFTLFGSRSDQALITMTGFHHRSFRYLLNTFEPLYTYHTSYHRSGYIRPLSKTQQGIPRSLSATQSLVLVLTLYRTRGSTFTLCMLFGVTLSFCNLFLRFGPRLLHHALRRYWMSSVNLPSPSEVPPLKAQLRRIIRCSPNRMLMRMDRRSI